MLSVCMCALGEKENMNFLLKHNLSCKVGKGIVICSWMTLATKALSESNSVTQWNLALGVDSSYRNSRAGKDLCLSQSLACDSLQLTLL